jgi:hypothetical protein
VALRGTLRDFSLGEILQLIGYQRKTGILSIEGEEDTVSISFSDGKIVEADSLKRHIDNRLGNLLVRAQKIRPEALAPILEEQRRSGVRLGTLLVSRKVISLDDLRDALRTQTLNLIYRIFRWSDGRYHFSQESNIKYDPELFVPVSTDNVLMESARMIDEWPMIQKRIRSFQSVFQKAEGTENLTLVSGNGEKPPGALAVSPEETAVWNLIDGKRSVTEVIDSAFLSDFDVVKALDEMIVRQLVVEVNRPAEVPEAPPETAAHKHPTAPGVALWAALAALLALSIWAMPRNPANLLFHATGRRGIVGGLRHAVTVARLQRVDRAVEVTYLTEGRYPARLSEIAAGATVGGGELPGGIRDYRYILRTADGKYDLYGKSPNGGVDPSLAMSRTLDPVAQDLVARPKPLKKNTETPQLPATIEVVN